MQQSVQSIDALANPLKVTFDQVHVDVARNATDDFNLWHDPTKWREVNGNPYGGPIALGFQLEQLMEHLLTQYRAHEGTDQLIEDSGLHFSNYEVFFTDPVRVGEEVSVEVRRTRDKRDDEGTIVNLMSVKAGRALKVKAKQLQSATPLYLPDAPFDGPRNLAAVPDKSYIEDGKFFVKRKFLGTGSAKNLLVGSQVPQNQYFDELAERVRFPDVFPVALASGAIMQKALVDGYDLAGKPMVYTSHSFSVDQQVVARLRSNAQLHILVGEAEIKKKEANNFTDHTVPCYGILDDGSVLYRAVIRLAPLAEILEARNARS